MKSKSKFFLELLIIFFFLNSVNAIDLLGEVGGEEKNLCGIESLLNCVEDLEISVKGGEPEFSSESSFFVLSPDKEGGIVQIRKQTESGEKYSLKSDKPIKYNYFSEELTILEDNTILVINGESFENIVSDGNSKFKINSETGRISNAQFKTNEKGGQYTINGVTFKSLPNSNVFYDEEKGFSLEKGTEISDVKRKDIETKGDILFEGENIIFKQEDSFYDKLSFSGKVSLNEKGLILDKGQIDRKDYSIFGEKILIPDKKFDLEKYDGNYVLEEYEKENLKKIKISSSIYSADKDFSIKLNNDPFGTASIGKIDSLSIEVSKGDGIEMFLDENKNLLKIEQKSSEKGNTLISNGLNSLLINKEKIIDKSLSSLEINHQTILDGQYGVVPLTITSDSQQIKKTYEYLDNSDLIISENGAKISVVRSPLSNILDSDIGHTNLEKIALKMEETGFSLENSNSFFMKNFPEVFDASNKAGFSNIEKTFLIEKSIENLGEKSLDVFFEVPAIINKLEKYSTEEITNFVFDTSKAYSENYNIYSLEENQLRLYTGYEELLKDSIEKGFSLEETSSYIQNTLSQNELESLSFFKHGLNEYDGKNFEEIKNGISIINQEKISPKIIDFFSESNFKYSNVEDKSSFTKEYSLMMNDLLQNKNIPPQKIHSLTSLMEEIIKENPATREEILNNLDFKSRYKIFSIASKEEVSNNAINQIYSSFPTDFTTEIQKIDPEGINSLDFLSQLKDRNFKLEKILEKDKNFNDFLIKSTKEGLSQQNDLLFENVKKISEFEQYINQQEYEKLILERYQNSNSGRERVALSYLIKEQSEISKNEEIKNIAFDLPTTKNADILNQFASRDELGAKLYFYDDEYSYEITRDKFIDEGFKVVSSQNNKNHIVLEKEENGKILKIDLEKLKVIENEYKGEKPKNILEIIDGDEFQFIGFRGHCYYRDEIFGTKACLAEEVCIPVKSNSQKIIQDGSCWSNDQRYAYEKNFPKSAIITDKNYGVGAVSNKFLYELFFGIANEKTSWEDYKKFEKEGFVFPVGSSISLEKWYSDNLEYFEEPI